MSQQQPSLIDESSEGADAALIASLQEASLELETAFALYTESRARHIQIARLVAERRRKLHDYKGKFRRDFDVEELDRDSLEKKARARIEEGGGASEWNMPCRIIANFSMEIQGEKDEEEEQIGYGTGNENGNESNNNEGCDSGAKSKYTVDVSKRKDVRLVSFDKEYRNGSRYIDGFAKLWIIWTTKVATDSTSNYTNVMEFHNTTHTFDPNKSWSRCMPDLNVISAQFSSPSQRALASQSLLVPFFLSLVDVEGFAESKALRVSQTEPYIDQLMSQDPFNVLIIDIKPYLSYCEAWPQ